MTRASARTFLFVPGHRPDRFARAMAAGADAVIIDLEDAVVPADKAAARANVRAWLQDGHEAVVRPAFGSVDLATQLGVDHRSHNALQHARSALVLAAASAGCAPPIDGVTTSIDDPAVLADDLRHATELGFTGKLCVHPRQVPIANHHFSPTEDEIEWARAVLQAAGDGSVAVLDGEMIDRPVVLRAQAILARA